MEYWMFGFCIVLLCTTMVSTTFWVQTKELLAQRTERYNECVRNREQIKQLLERARTERDLLVVKYNGLVEEFNGLLRTKNNLQEAYDKALAKNAGETLFNRNDYRSTFADTKPVGKNEFSAEELKRIRFAIHPDKNGGKTTELWRKINDMVK